MIVARIRPLRSPTWCPRCLAHALLPRSAHGPTHRQEAGHFVRWAARQNLTGLAFPVTRWQGPARALDDHARREAARRLLHDDTLNIRDRLAGLLVLLYAQKTAMIGRVTISHLETSG